MSNKRELPHGRAGYRHFQRVTTRWMDNDAYGHVNNVVYLSWFDTVVNDFLIRAGVLDPQRSNVVRIRRRDALPVSVAARVSRSPSKWDCEWAIWENPACATKSRSSQKAHRLPARRGISSTSTSIARRSSRCRCFRRLRASLQELIA